MPIAEPQTANNPSTDNTGPAASASLATLHARLEALFSCHANQFDPVRFLYLDSMARRAAQHSSTVSAIIAGRALQALDRYQADYEGAKSTASQQLEQIRLHFPGSAAIAQLQFSHSQFKALQQLSDQLQQPASTAASLRDLSRLLASQQFAVDSSKHGSALDHFLHREENELRQHLLPAGQQANEQREAIGQPLHQSETGLKELRSTRRFRHTQLKHTTRKVLNKAIVESPQDPGPLNPQMLALRALTRMQELSPDYVNRFVSYIDSLLWLEQANKQAASNKSATKTSSSGRKKPRRRKS